MNPRNVDAQRITETLAADQQRRASSMAQVAATEVEGGAEAGTAFGGQAWEAVQSLPETALSGEAVAAAIGKSASQAGYQGEPGSSFDPSRRVNRPFCVDFVRNRCRRGEGCPFLHPMMTPMERATIEDADAQEDSQREHGLDTSAASSSGAQPAAAEPPLLESVAEETGEHE